MTGTKPTPGWASCYHATKPPGVDAVPVLAFPSVEARDAARALLADPLNLEGARALAESGRLRAERDAALAEVERLTGERDHWAESYTRSVSHCQRLQGEVDEWAAKCAEMAVEAVTAESRARKAEERLALADPGQYASSLADARERNKALEAVLRGLLDGLRSESVSVQLQARAEALAACYPRRPTMPSDTPKRPDVEGMTVRCDDAGALASEHHADKFAQNARAEVTRLQGEVERLTAERDEARTGYDWLSAHAVRSDIHARTQRDLTAARERIEALESALRKLRRDMDGDGKHFRCDYCGACWGGRVREEHTLDCPVALLPPTPKETP